MLILYCQSPAHWQPMLRGKGGKGSDESSDEEEYKYRSPPSKVVKKLIPTGPTTDDKKRNRLTSMLFKQKEQLKKDIAKKRAQLEKELSADIAAEVFVNNQILCPTNFVASGELFEAESSTQTCSARKKTARRWGSGT